MQRVWVVVLSVWAMLAIVAVLAWSYRAPALPRQALLPQAVVQGSNGKQRLVVVSSGTHATTATSAAAARP